jgi:hypothetical protein
MGDKLASEATYRELAEALVLALSVGRNGSRSPEAHASTAESVVAALIARQQRREGGAS